MDTRNALLKYKQLLGITIAGVILTVIFVPFQQAQAFTVQLDIPNASSGHVTQASTGEEFNISVNVPAGEFISVSNVDIIIDNGQSSVTRTTFGSDGAYVSGAMGVVKNNTLTITPVASQTGYGYGYGIIASGISQSGNTFSFTGSTTGSIAGNNGGSSNAVSGANQVVGLAGPGTINIQTHLNTALLSVGSHTLDVVINTGAGGNGNDRLLAPQLAFTVDTNSHITTGSVSTGTNSTTSFLTSDNKYVSILFANALNSGFVSIQDMIPSFLQSLYPAILQAIGASASSFSYGGSTAITAGTIYDIDISSIAHTGFIYVTIQYDPNLLPTGMSENDVKFFHWTGTAWEDVTVSVDTAANTVTGKLTSLSPVVAGYIQSSSTSTSTTTTSVGGGGGGGSVILNPTLPADYFSTNPLAKLQIQNSAFKDLTGSTVLSAKPGQQVSINASFKNYQQTPQDYAMIIQVVDQNGFTTDIGWVTGTVNAGEIADSARSWTPETAGNYTIKIFVWDNVSTNPIPLSEITTKYFSAAE